MLTQEMTSHQYLNLETFRKSGVGVKTPVWFVVEGSSIFIRTAASSGKVKRLRRNPCVNIAPCRANGSLLGEWVQAEAREVTDQKVRRRVEKLLDKKYGLATKLFSIAAGLKGWKHTVLEIQGSGGQG
jgi:uncharacterized protein